MKKKLTNYKARIVIAAAVALAAALTIGTLAITAFPNGPVTVTVTHTEYATGPPFNTTTTVSTNTNTTGLLVGYPAAISEQNLSCSLLTGVCALTILNNNTVSLDLESCNVEIIASVNTTSTGSVTEYISVNGTIGGQAAAGIPSRSQVTATCTVPTADLTHQAEGSVAQGGFTAKLEENWFSYPAGTETTFPFQSTWS